MSRHPGDPRGSVGGHANPLIKTFGPAAFGLRCADCARLTVLVNVSRHYKCAISHCKQGYRVHWRALWWACAKFLPKESQ